MKKIISVTALILSVILIFVSCSVKQNEEIKNDKENTQIEAEINETETNDKTEENVKEDKEDKEEIKEDANKKPVSDEKEEIKHPENEKKELSISEVMNVMISQIPADENSMSELPKDLYKDMFGIDPSQFEDVLIYAPMMNVKANEIVLIKVKNEADISKATSALEERRKQTYATWEQYLPDQFEIVKQAKIATNGKYAALIITSYVDKVNSAFMGI